MMSSTIIPLSLQEPLSQRSLDLACISVPWLLTCGFSTAFAALFTKAWRINRVFQNAVEMRRVEIHPRDVLWPFAILSLCNVGLLFIWTIVAPPAWKRSFTSSTDEFGREIESFGTCEYYQGSFGIVALLVVLFNFLAVLFANYQIYVGRNNPKDFNESQSITISMGSLLECFLLGIPILSLVPESPVALFLLQTITICMGCAAIMVPMFVPKMTMGKAERETDEADLRSSLSNSLHHSFRTRPKSSGGNKRNRSRAGSFASSYDSVDCDTRINFVENVSPSTQSHLPSSVFEIRRKIAEKKFQDEQKKSLA